MDQSTEKSQSPIFCFQIKIARVDGALNVLCHAILAFFKNPKYALP